MCFNRTLLPSCNKRWNEAIAAPVTPQEGMDSKPGQTGKAGNFICGSRHSDRLFDDCRSGGRRHCFCGTM
jgi:hypothetical protein